MSTTCNLYPRLQQRLAYVPGDVGLWPNLIHQKLVLISALASDVELLLLDEPTADLSPLIDVVFHRAIREAKDANTTVLLSSHMLSQVEMLADRISIVRQGGVVETGSLDEL